MNPIKELAHFGAKRRLGYVRVVRGVWHGEAAVRVEWSEIGKRRTQSFPDTRAGIAEARAFAEAKHEAITNPAPAAVAPITIRELHEKYLTAKVDDWRPRTLTLHLQRWGKFLLFAGPGTPAHLITRERMDEFKRALFANKHSANQVRRIIDAATSVFRWSVDRDLIAPSKVATYRLELGRDAKRQAPTMLEYRTAERDRILAVLDPRNIHHWRAWALTTLLAYCGPRVTAALSLEWRDIDFEAGRIHWRPELDKMGGDRYQPMPGPVRDAFWLAYGWRLERGYAGRWVFFGARERTQSTDRPWGYPSYVRALHEAEKRAGLVPMKYKAAHAFRRGVAGDLVDLTGSEKAAAEWIGDRDVRVVKRSYLKDRDDRMSGLADLLSHDKPQPRTDDEAVDTNRDETQQGATMGAPEES
jgi:integrase